jgi:hypothetical protein
VLLTLLRLSESFPPLLPRRWYCATYNARTPTHQWAAQFLGLNITHAYARHLFLCRDRLSSPSAEPNPGFGTIFRYPSYVAVSRRPPRPRRQASRHSHNLLEPFHKTSHLWYYRLHWRLGK